MQDINKGDFAIVILAAGMGRNLKKYGNKSLFALPGHETIIARQIRMCRAAFGGVPITVVVGYEGDRIEKLYGDSVSVVENEFYEFTSTARSLLMGLRTFKHKNVLVLHGDLLFNADALKGNYTGSFVLVDDAECIWNNEVGIGIVDDHAQNLCYGLNPKWAQISFLLSDDCELIKFYCRKNAGHRKMFDFELINMLIDRNRQIGCARIPNSHVFDIDHPKLLKRAIAKDENIMLS